MLPAVVNLRGIGAGVAARTLPPGPIGASHGRQKFNIDVNLSTLKLRLIGFYRSVFPLSYFKRAFVVYQIPLS